MKIEEYQYIFTWMKFVSNLPGMKFQKSLMNDISFVLIKQLQHLGNESLVWFISQYVQPLGTNQFPFFIVELDNVLILKQDQVDFPWSS
jgi:hypothetical protein